MWSQARVIVLAPIAFAAVGCSADPARFNDGSFRRQPDATGTLAARAAPERAAPPAGAVRLVPPGSIPANDGANRNAGVAAGGVAYGGAPEDPPIKISRPTVKSPVAVARADTIPAQAKASGGHEIVQPKVANARQPGKPAPEQHPAAPAVPKPAVVAPAEKPVGVDPVKATEAAPSFHWPVRGQVIAGFGPKADGQRNNGIDIAVPENTPIKAADDGVVIYSGNELKSFGNLLLVRHSNNYITAYAHAKELRVKRGDTIKSGEIIGMSGQSGNTDTPEIHFEIRKGSTPIDPVPLLHGA